MTGAKNFGDDATALQGNEGEQRPCRSAALY
jgi:hypothetical protein